MTEIIFEENKKLLREIRKAVIYMRRQEYLYAVRGVTRITDLLMELVPKYIQNQNFYNEHQNIVDENAILTLLQELLDTQKADDKILLADILELKLQPLVISLQEIYSIKKGAPDIGMEGYRIEPTSCGFYTLNVCGNEGWRYLHTNGNVLDEAQIIAESWFDGECFSYVIYGMGMGYHIQALLELDEMIQVVVIEADRNVLDIARQYGATDLWKEKERVKIVYDPEFKELVKYAGQLEDGKQKFLIYYPSMQCINNSHYYGQLENYFIQYSSAKSQMTRLVANFHQNEPGFVREVTECKSDLQGKDLYIVAAGPSLDKNIMELKKVAEKDTSIILATGTVLKKMLHLGIKPDYVIIIDGGKFTYKQTEELECYDVPLWYMSTVYYKIPAEYRGDKYVILQKGFTKSEDYAKSHNYPLYDTGGSVTTTALDIGIRFGCRRIIFVGLDLAYTGDKDHASDTAAVKTVQRENLLMVEDIYGQKVYTAKNLDIYRQWIENRIEKEKGIEFMDATEGGAKIKGTSVCKLGDV